MAISQKYGRTYHYPFSPGTTSDDRIQHDYWELLTKIPELVHTEKLDGENNCLSRYGVFARSHAAPTTSAWTESIRRYWQSIRNDLGQLEIFLENVYAIHSITYKNLDHHFYVLGIREGDRWLSWEETRFYAAMLDLPVVPEIKRITPPATRQEFEKDTLALVNGRGAFDPYDVHTGQPTVMEGIVSRNAAGYPVAAFAENVFKYVRKGHVKTDQHWTRHWQRAALNYEGGYHVADQ
ncbi:RNA ligase family protein [Chitinophaga nivalis]|uniref:RNA ligase family protein n=1 Tax=Chitinophaga nivalis TaxID=2991709 RepID=A0ABT3IQP4_9BACT|nr:RNA ligase family protein [Chitinophaga nivalis]MCW3464270.1 RNA ligase family protein [Chitinophaga nivalis]MCW3486039.1 RNA ligase family protein [Chitinophaga nivalis]